MMRNRRLGIIAFKIVRIEKLVVDGRVRKQGLQIAGWLIQSNKDPRGGPQLRFREALNDRVQHFSFRHGLPSRSAPNRRSIAFPSISTGIFGYPIEAAAAIAVSTLLRGSREPGAPELIRLCLFAAADLEVYGAALAAAREDGR